MKVRTVLLFAALLPPVVVRSASAQHDVESPTNPLSVASVSTFDVDFAQLVGMQVSWVSNGHTYSDTWRALGGGLYGVSGTNLTLSASGLADTYNFFDPYQWTLDAKDLTSLTIDPLSINAVFDITPFPTVGTPGSSYGLPFDYGACFIGCFATPDSWNTTATYSEPIGVGSASPDDDLYGQLKITFGKTFGDDRSGDEVQFSQDLDLVTQGKGIVQDVTPEPATMTLMATGLVGMAGVASRRRRKTI